jgi:hypothetical protein
MVLIFYGKLRLYEGNGSTSAMGQAAPTKPSQPTAADILGLNRQRNLGQKKTVSLEMEVDQYLSDPNQGTGILEYWQVDLFSRPIYIPICITNVHCNF